MGKFNEDQIESNFQKMIVSDDFGDENDRGKDIENFKLTIQEFVDDITFQELDDYFENGIDLTENFFSHGVHALMIGYSLITRYGVEYDDYVEWANKQDVVYRYALLKLIGIEDDQAKKQIDQKKYDDRIDYQKGLVDYLKDRKRVIQYTDESTGFTLFGKNIKIDPVAKDIGGLIDAVDSAAEYAKDIFWKQYESKCTDYKAVYSNIVRVFDDAYEAAWIRVRRYLKKSIIDESSLEAIHSDYRKTADVTPLTDEFDECFDQLEGVLQKGAEQIANKDANRRSHQMVGGGFGLAGMATGVIAAGAVNKVRGAYADVRTKGDVEKIKRETVKALNEAFCGDEMREMYSQLLDAGMDALLESSLKIVYPDKIEDPKGFDHEKERFSDEFLRQLTDEEYRNLFSELFFIYPFHDTAYFELSYTFCGISGELAAIGHYLTNDERYRDIVETSFMMAQDHNNAIWSNLNIELSENEQLIIEPMHCGNHYVRLEIPDGAYVLGDINGRRWATMPNQNMAEDLYFKNTSSGIILRYWTGYEGPDVFQKEYLQTTKEDLEQINSWENYGIKDFEQEVLTRKNDESKTIVVHGYLDKKYDSYLLLYICKDYFFNICIAEYNSEHDEQLLNRVKNVINGISFKALESFNNKYFGLSKFKIRDSLAVQRKSYTEKYWNEHSNDGGVSFGVEFRKNIKALLCSSKYSKNLVCKYDYEIKDSIISNVTNDLTKYSQYVLYSSERFLITDYYIIIKMKTDKIVSLSELVEMFPIKDYITSFLLQICVRYLNGSVEYVDISDEKDLDEIMFISEMINVTLDSMLSSSYARYYQEATKKGQKEIIFCKHCEKIAYVKHENSKVLNKVSCSNCGTVNTDIRRIIVPKSSYFSPQILDENIHKSQDIFAPETELSQQYNIPAYDEISIQNESKDAIDKMEKLKATVEEWNGSADFYSASLYRALFKYYMTQLVPESKAIINTYDILMPRGSLLSQTVLKETNEAGGQYILYAHSGIIITDFRIYFCTNDTTYSYQLNDIFEIVTLEKRYGNTKDTFYIRKRDGKIALIEGLPVNDDVAFVIDVLNLVLESAHVGSNSESREHYFRESSTKEGDPYIWCPSCRRWAVLKTRGKWINNFYCSACGHNLTMNGSFYMKRRNNKISEILKFENPFLESNKIIELVEHEKEEDDQIHGVLSLGISLYEKAQQAEKERAEKKQTDSDEKSRQCETIASTELNDEVKENHESVKAEAHSDITEKKENIQKKTDVGNGESLEETVKKLCLEFIKSHNASNYSAENKKMVEMFKINDSEIYLAHDDTLMKSGKNGYIITNKGIYARALMSSKVVFTPFNKLARISEYTIKNGELYGNNILLGYDSTKAKDLKNLLLKITAALTNMPEVNKSSDNYYQWTDDDMSSGDNAVFVDRFMACVKSAKLEGEIIDSPITKLSDPELNKKLQFMAGRQPNQKVLYVSGNVTITDKYIIWSGLPNKISIIKEIGIKNEKQVVIELKNSEKYLMSNENQPELFIKIINYALGNIENPLEEKKETPVEDKKDITCIKCGKQVPAGSRFCCYCGAEVLTAMVECPSCKKMIARTARFCNYCGARREIQ